MKKFWIQFFLLIIFALGLLYLGFNNQLVSQYFPTTPGSLSKTQIQINGNTINIEVADTPSKRNQGLSGRESLAPDTGMLFVFPEEKRYQFWMKNMKFPLDMIFIRKGIIVDILKNVSNPTSDIADQYLPRYSPVAPIDMMLEVPSGFTESRNIRVGDSIFLIK